MAKADSPSTATTSGDSSSPYDQKNLIAALTAAIIASRRDTQEPSPEAKAAAKQYGDIKRALGTHAEPFPTQGSRRTRKS
jgi:hypothetical protein